MNDTTVSVVLVTHNSRRHLARCLPALFTTDESLEVIIVDNASTDQTCEWVESEFGEILVLRSESNLGYGAACNRGLRTAHGRYALVLNPDTIIAPGALHEMLDVVRRHPNSFVTPKLLLSDGRVNACGNEMHISGIVSCTGFGQQASSITGVRKPFLLSGAAILARREAWLDLSGFAEWCFMYFEDADLSLRARARGYEILCSADACMIHDYHLRLTPLKFYFLQRNKLALLQRSFNRTSLIRLLPGVCLGEAMTVAYALLRGPRYIQSVALAHMWFVRNLGSQAECEERKGTSKDFLVRMVVNLPFNQIVTSGRSVRILNRLTTPVFQSLKLAVIA